MNRFSVIPVFVLMVFLFGITGCVSSAKYRMLEETAASDQARLQDEIRGLLADADAVKDENTQLTEQIAILKEERSEKEEEIARLTGTYESLVEDLKGEIEKGEIQVTQIKNRLTVNLVEKVLFNSGQAKVNQKGKDILRKVGVILKKVEDKNIRIEGYTDNIPIGGALKKKFPSNWELSTQRATHVLRFLQDETGVDGSRLSAVGHGEFGAIASNETRLGRSQNRRIEIVLVPQDVEKDIEEVLQETD